MRQYKHGAREILVELPGGYVDDGEDPLATARRELREETGHDAPAWRPLGVYHGNPTKERGNDTHIYLATGAHRVAAPRLDDTEDIEALAVPVREVYTPAFLDGLRVAGTRLALELARAELAGLVADADGARDRSQDAPAARSGTSNRLARMAGLSVHPLAPADADWVERFTIEHWGAPIVAGHGVVYRPRELPGFVAMHEGERVGLVTYRIADGACEIVTLDSARLGIGVGTGLIDAVAAEARRQGCARVWLITTNDNLHALGFYQKRGFALVAVHRNAVEESRKIKPEIPLAGDNGIPIRDELELELPL